MIDTVIYHKNCFDGVTAAYVVHRYCVQRRYPIPSFVAANYGDAPPDVRGSGVVIVDFSYHRHVLEEMARVSSSMLVLDHHKTAEDDLKGLPYAVFDMEKSGAGIAWDWFFVGKPRPWLVDCVEDRDLWRFKLPATKYQMAFIATVPMDFENWAQLFVMDPAVVAEKGGAIQSYITNYGIKAREHIVMMDIGGFWFPVMNLSYMNCSDHLNSLIDSSVFDRAASFFLRSDLKWQFSLRSEGDFDVSAIAKMYGGGGHKHAAGFELDQAGFNVIMKGLKESR